MNSPKNKTQQHRTQVKNLSTVLAIGLAMVTLLQAGNVKSEKAEVEMSHLESELIAEVDAWFATEEDTLLEEQFLAEAVKTTEANKVFDSNGDLIMEGDPAQNESLRQLVNQAEYMSSFSGVRYYSLTK